MYNRFVFSMVEHINGLLSYEMRILRYVTRVSFLKRKLHFSAMQVLRWRIYWCLADVSCWATRHRVTLWSPLFNVWSQLRDKDINEACNSIMCGPLCHCLILQYHIKPLYSFKRWWVDILFTQSLWYITRQKDEIMVSCRENKLIKVSHCKEYNIVLLGFAAH